MEATVPAALLAHAADHPAHPLITEVDGGSVTYSELLDRSLRWAALFESIGVGPGDNVVTMTEPCIDSFAAWFGLGWLRAVDTACNTQYRGPMLVHLFTDSRAKVALVEGSLVDRIEEVAAQLPDLEAIVVIGESSAPGWSIRQIDASSIHGIDPVPQPELPTEDTTALILYTSGTTGPSKGVMLPWGALKQFAVALSTSLELGRDDVFYSPYPVYHGTGRGAVSDMILAGGGVVLRRTFTGTKFWEDISRYGCTITVLLGPVAAFLWNQPPRDDDADNPLAQAFMLPLVPEYEAFAERFGVALQTGFGMSEIGVPFVASKPIPNHLTCGRPMPGFHIRLVGPDGADVDLGEVGELVVRHDDPNAMATGYFGLDEKTQDAWRDGWFHSGDAFRADAEGNYYFVDRVKDAIRRKGENISSFEVEAIVGAHPAVAEVAAIAVPAELGEDEVKICVVRAEGEAIDARTLVADLVPSMPRFMVPRYVEFVDALPRTNATMRIKKAELRAAHDAGRCWDREDSDLLVPR